MNATSHKQSATSFRKKGTDVKNVRGTRVSIQNAQLLASTGSSTLDFFIGGGLAVGTICLIEEDHYNTYSNLLLKYFLAEAVTCGNAVLLASGDKDPHELLKELPSAKTIEFDKEVKQIGETLNDNLKIAWRYKNQSVAEPIVKSQSYNHGYDLSKTMPEEILQTIQLTTWDPSRTSTTENDFNNFIQNPYSSLLEKVRSEISSKFKTSDKSCDNVLRIGICSIGSPLWQSGTTDEKYFNLLRFLFMLKALLRTSYSVAVVTVPSFLMQNVVLISRMRQIVDTVIKLESFVGSDKKSNPLFKDFDGLLHIKKLPILNTYVYRNPTPDLAFKLKRKGFLIERMHMPPDLEESSSEVPSSFGCSGQGSKLDF